jgi:hypothetical protein
MAHVAAASIRRYLLRTLLAEWEQQPQARACLRFFVLYHADAGKARWWIFLWSQGRTRALAALTLRCQSLQALQSRAEEEAKQVIKEEGNF